MGREKERRPAVRVKKVQKSKFVCHRLLVMLVEHCVAKVATLVAREGREELSCHCSAIVWRGLQRNELTFKSLKTCNSVVLCRILAISRSFFSGISRIEWCRNNLQNVEGRNGPKSLHVGGNDIICSFR